MPWRVHHAFLDYLFPRYLIISFFSYFQDTSGTHKNNCNYCVPVRNYLVPLHYLVPFKITLVGNIRNMVHTINILFRAIWLIKITPVRWYDIWYLSSRMTSVTGSTDRLHSFPFAGTFIIFAFEFDYFEYGDYCPT